MAFSIHRSALVLHSSERMFDLVNDIHSYPTFLSWCENAQVINHSNDEMVAALGLAKGAVKYQFTTRNQLTAPNKIAIELVDGPFKQLKGAWEFIDLGDMACKVMLSLEFEFKSLLGKVALEQLFNSVANSLVDAFCERANKVYPQAQLSTSF